VGEGGSIWIAAAVGTRRLPGRWGKLASFATAPISTNRRLNHSREAASSGRDHLLRRPRGNLNLLCGLVPANPTAT